VAIRLRLLGSGSDGCVSGKGVVTFARRRDLNIEALAEMITAIEAGIAAGQRTVT